MALVYQNSACTIAALFSESTHSGCFSVRYENGSSSHQTHHFKTAEGGLTFAMARYPTEDVETNVEEHNLNSRAWVFQERLLSPRTLGFSETGIIWDCKESQYKETRPTFDSSKYRYGNMTREKEMLRQVARPVLQGHGNVINRREFLKAWYELVTDYSGLKLTFPSDKLVALAGLSSRLRLSSGYIYFYGL